MDDDCDGLTDGPFPTLGDPCDGADLDLCDNGILVCDAAGADVSCEGESPLPINDVCNGEDDDCDGLTDEGFDVGAPCGVGACEGGLLVCTDDGAATWCPTMPGGEGDLSAPETCGGGDEDCDGTVDEPSATDASTWYLDYDGDGFGNDDFSVVQCESPPSYEPEGGDCNDLVATIHPDGDELCDGVDNDCDQITDEADALDAMVWHLDSDGDDYGDPEAVATSCSAPDGYVADDSDCDDGDGLVSPGALEITDGVDNDCDGQTDESAWGTGADGALVVDGLVDLSVYASPGRTSADAVAYPVAAIAGADILITTQPAGLEPGDELLLINLQGTAAAHAAAGRWAFATVASLGSNSITLTDASLPTLGQVSNADLSGQTIVAQRVPQYAVVDVLPGGTLTMAGWDGGTGGVLALRATSAVHVEAGGTVTVHAGGFAGGATGVADNCDAYQGESYAGAGVGNICGGPYNELNGGWQPNFGGGGALVTGGGGEHGGGATPGASWNGGPASAPLAGLPYGVADLSIMLLGSGGGGVWNGSQGPPGPGGAGGGILLVAAPTIIADTSDAFVANGGTTPFWAQGSWTYGAGGGAGGVVWLIAQAAALAPAAVNATGGFGEASHIRDGGDGGVGRVRIDFEAINGLLAGDPGAAVQLPIVAQPPPGFSGSP